MSMLKRIIFASFLAVATFSITVAQDSVNSVAQKSSVTITAAAFADRIRITAPASVAGMHVEVFAASGEKVLDQEIKNGNVFDWQLPSGQRLPAGRYVCLVTTKSISGRLTRRLGAVKVDDLALSVEPADSAQLSAPQAQAIGPVEENSSWTVLGSDENQTPTVIAHDGTDGQLTRGHGALTFRFGDFFSGKDTEQMRLTEEGNLGIGTANPKVKLDVVGMISAREGFRFADGSTLNVNDKGVLTRTTASGELVPNIAGTGTQNKLARWIDNSGTLGDSVVTELGGNLGVGVTNPAQKLHVVRSFSGTNPLTPDRIGAFVNDGNPANHSILAVIAGSNGVAGIDLGDTQNQNQSYVRYNNGTLGEKLRFGINNTDVLALQSNGNVGIGTSAPAHKLEVTGNISASGDYYRGGDRILSVTSSTSGNTFVGVGAGANNTLDSTSSSFFGRLAGFNNIDGQANSFFGRSSGIANDHGDFNSFFGLGSGSSNTSGNRNSFMGLSAGSQNTTGSQNTFLGMGAGAAVDENSTVIPALSNSVEDHNTFIGYRATGGGVTNATAIGSRAHVTQSNSLVLGSINGVNLATANTKVGIGTTAPAAMLDIQGEGTTAFLITTYGAGADNVLTLRAAGGTRAAPTATTLGQELMALRGAGHTGSAFSLNTPARIDFTATENWTSGATGVQMSFWTGQNGTTASVRRMTITNDGNVGIGGSPSSKLHVSESIDASATPENHVAQIQNTSTGTNADVLALKIGRTTAPETSNNYITFFKGDDTTAGAIQGNGSGSVVLAGAGADYAEWLPRLNPAEQIQPGEIVGLHNGLISKQTRGAAQVMAISTGPIVLGNDPGEQARGGFERVAFIGQVMVRVRGKVQAGDFIVASGLDDGVAVAVSPEFISSEQFARAVGQAWEASSDPGVKSVRTAVGLIQRDPTVSRQLESSRRQDAQITALKTENAALRRQNSSMDVRLSALELMMKPKTARHKASDGRTRRTSKHRAG